LMPFRGASTYSLEKIARFLPDFNSYDGFESVFLPKRPGRNSASNKGVESSFSCFARFEGATMMKSCHVTNYAFSKPMLTGAQMLTATAKDVKFDYESSFFFHQVGHDHQPMDYKAALVRPQGQVSSKCRSGRKETSCTTNCRSEQ